MPCDRRGWGGGRGREPVVVLLKTLQSLNREPWGSLFFLPWPPNEETPFQRGRVSSPAYLVVSTVTSYNKPPSNRSSRSEWREWTEGYFGTITPAPSRTRHTGSTTMRSTTTCRPRRQRSASQRWGSAVRTANQRLAARLDEPLTLVPALVRVHLFSHAHRRHAPDPHLEDEILSDRHGRLERRGRRSSGYWTRPCALRTPRLDAHSPRASLVLVLVVVLQVVRERRLKEVLGVGVGSGAFLLAKMAIDRRIPCVLRSTGRRALARRPPPFASPYSTLTRATVRTARSPAS